MRLVPLHIAQAVLDLESDKTLGPGDLARSVAKFLKRKRLLGHAGPVLQAIQAETARRAGRIAVTATTARELDGKTRTLVQSKATELFGSPTTQVVVEYREDPELIGGIRLSSENQQYDFSLRRSLNQLRTQL